MRFYEIGRVRRKNVLRMGSFLGVVLSVSGLQMGMNTLNIVYLGTLVLCFYSCLCIFYFALNGWPVESINFDIYDINRFVFGTTISAIVVAVFFAVISKLSTSLSLNPLYAIVITTLAFLIYMGTGAVLYTIARNKWYQE